MIQTFIEKNRRLLRFYCLVARILGWVLTVGGVFWFFLTVATSMNVNFGENTEPLLRFLTFFLLYAFSSLLYDFFLPGIIAFGVAQLLRYLITDDYKPDFILRNADRLLYTFAGLLVLTNICRYSWYVDFKFLEIVSKSEFSRILFVQPFLLPTLAKVLILVGIAQIFRRLLPVIEEYKIAGLRNEREENA
ncbi:MAG: hypothetical protein KAQ89_05875 [Planctomycetes bacterium]|nr:hypothetical protein [Planctomycetota bacterium]